MNPPKNGFLKFYADWCGPCKAVAPLLKKVTAEANVELVEVDIEQHPELASQFGVRSIPMVVALRNGEPVDASVGSHNEDHYVNMIQKVLE